MATPRTGTLNFTQRVYLRSTPGTYGTIKHLMSGEYTGSIDKNPAVSGAKYHWRYVYIDENLHGYVAEYHLSNTDSKFFTFEESEMPRKEISTDTFDWILIPKTIFPLSENKVIVVDGIDTPEYDLDLNLLEIITLPTNVYLSENLLEINGISWHRIQTDNSLGYIDNASIEVHDNWASVAQDLYYIDFGTFTTVMSKREKELMTLDYANRLELIQKVLIALHSAQPTSNSEEAIDN